MTLLGTACTSAGRPRGQLEVWRGPTGMSLEGERCDVLLRTPLRAQREAQAEFNPGRAALLQGGGMLLLIEVYQITQDGKTYFSVCVRG